MLREIGANYIRNNQCEFTVWAPLKTSVEVEFASPGPKRTQLERDDTGYWHKKISGISSGTQYRYILDGKLERPDPASRAQPDGVHSWSRVEEKTDYGWNDSDWEGIALQDMIIYELHVGTFTPEGTFEAITTKLDHLIDLGVNTIELMPISQFPGNRNWGYDGVYPYAAQNSYGGITGLKNLVDVCHQKGIAIILDVVYNHMGPEGNYLEDYGPYFTDKYKTPWGKALNFDDAYCDPVRSFFVQNALMWLDEFHIDGLRLDAVHAILDFSAQHFLQQLRKNVDELEKKNRKRYYLIAESDMNDVKLISPYSNGGYGLDAQWVDDFHHAIHTLATGEQNGYYTDFGNLEHLAKAFKQGYVYDGTFSSFRKKSVGNNPHSQLPHHFVVCIQNHDQVGNRMLGERLSQLVSYEMLKLAAGILFISPFVPMLFMGEEYGEENPFLYFVSHGDSDLVKAVQEGRKKEFESFKWKGKVPDPQAEATFNNSKLQWNYHSDASKKTLFNYYKHLISLRKSGEFLGFSGRSVDIMVHEKEKAMIVQGQNVFAIVNFSKELFHAHVPANQHVWQKIMASSDSEWNGPGGCSPEIIERGKEIAVGSESIDLYKKKI